MLIINLLEGVLAVFLLLVVIVFVFVLIERLRLASGKELFTDRFIRYLEGIHRQTAPKDSEKPHVRDYQLSDKVRVRKVYFHDTK